MADWIPKDPTSLAELGGALGGVGLLGKFWDQIFSWFGKSHERQKDINTIVDERLKLALDWDGQRMAHLTVAVEGQSKEIEALREETTGLKTMIQTLIGHINSLEHILRTRQIDVPPRPDLTVG